MSTAVGFVLNLAGVIVPLASMAQHPEKPSLASTNVQIIIGHSGNDNDPHNQNQDPQELGGGCPNVALWDDCQYQSIVADD
jgi:hypothetical protein